MLDKDTVCNFMSDALQVSHEGIFRNFFKFKTVKQAVHIILLFFIIYNGGHCTVKETVLIAVP